MSKDVERTNSGLRKKGNWKEVAEFGEEVEEAIKDKARENSLNEFEEWRPKTEEAENDMRKKTVEKAVIHKNKLEKESKGVRDFEDAAEKFTEAGKKAAKRQQPSKELTEASEDVVKPFYASVAQLFRTIESLVYSKFALRGNTYYFDTEDFSVDMKARKDGRYEMDVNVPEEDTREELKKRFGEEMNE